MHGIGAVSRMLCPVLFWSFKRSSCSIVSNSETMKLRKNDEKFLFLFFSLSKYINAFDFKPYFLDMVSRFLKKLGSRRMAILFPLYWKILGFGASKVKCVGVLFFIF